MRGKGGGGHLTKDKELLAETTRIANQRRAVIRALVDALSANR